MKSSINIYFRFRFQKISWTKVIVTVKRFAFSLMDFAFGWEIKTSPGTAGFPILRAVFDNEMKQLRWEPFIHCQTI